jgi:hypothetical protein
LDDGAVTAGHVDEVTRATKHLEGDQRDELFDRLDDGLLDIAAVATVEDWRRRLAHEIRSIQQDDGVDKLTRQQRSVRLLQPVCAQHHTEIHDSGWDITLAANRELTIRFPDGTIHTTGPPKRPAA